MVLNSKRNYFIFLIIVLIISITPVCATLQNQTNEKIGLLNEQKALESSINATEIEMQEHLNELNIVATELYEYSKWDLFWMSIFKPGTVKELGDKLRNLKVPADKVKQHTAKLKNDFKRMHEIHEALYGAQYLNPENDARQMAFELSNDLNVQVTPETVPASEINEGDVIQYLDQGQYPQYLTVVKKKLAYENSTNSMPTQGDTAYTFYVQGVGDKIFPIVAPSALTRLSCPENVKEEITPNAAEIKQKKIDENNQILSSERRKAAGYKSKSDILSTVGVTLLVVGAVFAFTLEFEATMIAGSVSAAAVELSQLYLYEYTGISREADDLSKKIEGERASLKEITDQVNKKEINMNVTTFDGIPIIKRPPDCNWRELEAVVEKEPDHGKLLIGPGLQFLYGPDEGYTGNDVFIIKAVGNNNVNMKIFVNAEVKPIPVIQIPQEA